MSSALNAAIVLKRRRIASKWNDREGFEQEKGLDHCEFNFFQRHSAKLSVRLSLIRQVKLTLLGAITTMEGRTNVPVFLV